MTVVGIGVAREEILDDAVDFVEELVFAREGNIDFGQPHFGLDVLRLIFGNQLHGAPQLTQWRSGRGQASNP